MKHRDGPQTFAELLEAVPGLNYTRRLNAHTVRMLLNRKRKQCTWCGKPVTKGRSTCCSDECVEAFQNQCDITHQAAIVKREANGICAACGRDTMKSQRIWESIRSRYQWTYRDELVEERREILEMLGFRRNAWGEVDHLVAVQDGGGMLGITNLRYLCGDCHYRKTHKKK